MRVPPIFDSQAIARAFVEARQAGTALPIYPGTMPHGLADGYAAQDAAVAIAGGRVAGWKVGKVDPPVEGANRFVGPVMASGVIVADHRPPATAVFPDGFAAAEAEFVMRVGCAPVPARCSYTLEDTRALIDAVHVGIEIASSPFPGITAHGPAVTVSDFGNNNGLVVGAELPGWRERDLNAVPVELLIDGDKVGAATAATMLDGPWGAARFLLEQLAARRIALAAGSWISTGAVTGVHRVRVGNAIEARFDGQHSVRCTIIG